MSLVAIRRVWLWHAMATGDRIYFGGDTRSDELLAGCALAIWLHMEIFPWKKVQRIVPYLLVLAVLFIVGVVVHPLPIRIMYTLGWPIMELAVSIIILSLVASGGSGGPLRRLLEQRPLVWIGKLSYGLYLWHFPILAKVLTWSSLGIFRAPVGLILSFTAATASYYLVELRFLKRKRQFAST
jgi:peptidoglycan/LPS O-acetylase OafA/YrhL